MRFVKTVENLFGLPQGFTRAEYLETSGSKYYIDTGYKANNTTKVEIKTQGQTWTFGGRTSIAVGDALGICFNANLVALQFGSQSINYNQTGIAQQVSECVISQDGAYINGVLRASFTSETFSCPNNLYLFEINNNGSLGDGLKGKMWYCRIWDGDTLVRNYIPCIDPLGVPCMYDLVGKKPYYNQGTGDFTAGRQIIPVEYLEGTGTQYIDTGVRGFADFEIGIQLRNNASNVSIFCGNAYRLERYNASNPYWRFRNDNDFYNSGIPITEYHVMSWKNDEVYADGVKLQDFAKTWNVSANMTLFGASAFGSYPSMIYFCKLWNPTDGTLLRDYIPCKDENDNGFLFDKVSGVCYLNNGTGNFAFGENKYKTKLRLVKDNRLPAGYTQVEYIENTGKAGTRNWINTGIVPDATTRWEVRIAFNNTTTGKLMGCGYTTPNRFNIGIESNKFRFAFNGWFDANSNITTPDTNAHTWIMDAPSKTFTIDEYSTTTAYTFGASTLPICLFGRCNRSDGMTETTNVVIGKIYYTKIWQNNVLVRYLIPALDPSGTPCMYDLVTKTPFYNQGTGTFSYGKTISMVRFIKDVIPREYAAVNYIESTGTQYIDTGVEKGSVSVIRTVADLSFNNLSTINAAGWGQSLSGGCFGFKQNATYIYFNLTGADENSTLGYIAGKRLKFDLDGVNGKFTIYDGESVAYTATKTSSTSTNNDIGILFGFKNTSGINAKAQTIYSYKMYKNNILVRNFIPVVRRIDKVAGMWDTITKQFFGNSGTGNFNYG